MADKAPQQRVHIKVADSNELITAGLAEVVFFSAVAEEAAGLQAGNSMVTWDLSNAVINNKPVTSSTVRDWLNIVYKLAHGTSYETTYAPVTEAATLCDLLEFADAVQTRGGVIAACDSAINDEGLVMSIPLLVVGRSGFKIFGDGRGYSCILNAPNTFRFGHVNGGSTSGLKANQWTGLQQQVASQTERLLYLAHKLKLPVLLSRVEGFITANLLRQPVKLAGLIKHVTNSPIFTNGSLSSSVYSDRVCGCLGFPPEGSDDVKQEWLQSKHQLRLTIGGEGDVLQIIERSDATSSSFTPCIQGQQKLTLNTSLQVKFNKDFAGYSKGSVAEIVLTGSGGRFAVEVGTACYQLDMFVAQ